MLPPRLLSLRFFAVRERQSNIDVATGGQRKVLKVHVFLAIRQFPAICITHVSKMVCLSESVVRGRIFQSTV